MNQDELDGLDVASLGGSHSHVGADWNLKATTPPPPGFGDDIDIGDIGEPPRTPPPPGFRESDGIQLREALGGSTSAPPPPGFNTGMEGRKSLVSELFLQQESNDYGKPVAGDHANSATSFANLAAMFGTGLAESLDDATQEWSKGGVGGVGGVGGGVGGATTSQSRGNGSNNVWANDPSGARQPNRRDGSFDPLQDISFARMSRHAAARLIGSSPRGGDVVDQGAPAPAPASFLSNALDLPRNGNVSGGGSVVKTSRGDILLGAGAASRQHQHRNSAPSSSSFGGLPSGAVSPSATSPLFNRKGMEQRQQQMRALISGRDVGLTVMEPQEDNMSGRGGQQFNNNAYNDYYGNNNNIVTELEQEVKGLWVGGDGGRSDVSHLDQSIGNSSVGSNASASLGYNNDTSASQKAEADLRPFIWDNRQAEPSRTIVILRTSGLHVSDIRTTCEAFGVIETFRPDFSANRGVVFVGYYDIRSAQFAAEELKAVIQQLADAEGLVQNEIMVQYCVPLNSSTQFDESRIVLSDVPTEVDDNSLVAMLSSYGSVRTLTRHGGHYGGSSYEVEYHNINDAKQALLELASSQPWGPNVGVEEAMRTPIDRKRGRELLALIGRWRHGHSKGPQVKNLSPHLEIHRGTESSSSSATPAMAPPNLLDPNTQLTQVVLGPDGRYTVVMNQSTQYSPYGQPQHHPHHPTANSSYDPNRQAPQQIIHGPNGVTYITNLPSHSAAPPNHQPAYAHHNPHVQYWHQAPPAHQPHPSQVQHPHSHHAYPGTTVVTTSPYLDSHGNPTYLNSNAPGSSNGVPYYTHVVTSPVDQSAAGAGGGGPPGTVGGPNNHQHPQVLNIQSPHAHSSPVPGAGNAAGGAESGGGGASGGGGEKDNKHLVLDLDCVENGRDVRTSLMVRNIPNKYSQQMLLSEFTDNGLGPGVIDFFYLPIDFKNRCNRGYAFINFVDYKDILPFHRRYFGKHWSTFNSDKICDITYARIQGKAAMLKRFENSALMEKDEEYKPLVFVSHGAEKGKRIPFPEGGAGGAATAASATQANKQ